MIAHKIKPTVAMFGLFRLEKTFKKIEEIALNNNQNINSSENLEKLYERAEKNLQLNYLELKELLNK